MPHCIEWERVGVGLEFRCKYVAPLSASSTGFSQVRVEPVEAFQNLAIQNKDNLELNIYIIHQVHTGKMNATFSAYTEAGMRSTRK